MTAILGISAFYHDSAAALIVDGKVVAAAQEERFTRKKHDEAFPRKAIEYCLTEAGLSSADLDFVGFYEKPLLKFERLLETYLSYAPLGFHSFLKAMPPWLGQKLHLRREIRHGLDRQFRKRIIFCQHHESHAASAFYPSPFEQAAIVTLDGVGEWTTTSFGRGDGNQLKMLGQIGFPHSLGLLYSAFTYFSGFRVNSGEYKLMGLAPYGKPKYAQLIHENLIDVKTDGSFRLDMRYFNYCQGLTMTSKKFHQLFNAAPRKPETPIRELDMDLAASIQKVTEDVVLKIAHHVYDITKLPHLCLAGGVALNCVANGRLLREGPFDSIWIQPAAGDAGGALGVAQLIWYNLLKKARNLTSPDAQFGSLLGPTVACDSSLVQLKRAGAVLQEIKDPHRLVEQVANLLADEKVVGWVQGRMEYGPRALGSRSILGDPRSTNMQSVMNLKIKFRESFRPFAPSVLRERAAEIFELDSASESPYMLLVSRVRGVDSGDATAWQSDITEKSNTSAQAGAGNGPSTTLSYNQSRDGLDRVNEVRGWLPAITHVDGSARIQTVDPQRFPDYYRLLTAFERRTGCPVLINTSFNVRGEPIVCDAADAYRCFMATNMDVLVVDRYLMIKSEQPEARQFDADAHLNQFALD